MEGGPGSMEGSGSENGNSSAGVVTAGEWRDLDHWVYWSQLMTGEEFSGMSDKFKLYTDNLVAMHVTDSDDKPVIGTDVVLYRNGQSVWTAKTDNFGYAYLWVSPFHKLEQVSSEDLTVKVGGAEMAGHPVLSTWQSGKEVQINEFKKMTADAQPVISNVTDIAFIVDATGSMGDEIAFLKDDLVDILGKACAQAGNSSALRTAAVFYRDVRDTYLTQFDDFKTDYNQTVDFIKYDGVDEQGKRMERQAEGGGDYEEAVHTALEVSLQNLSWRDDARMRLAIVLLDAPAHYLGMTWYDEQNKMHKLTADDVLSSLQQSIGMYAQKGIRVIPILASGGDKNAEFMLRFFGILTGGTYTFLTNDSGVGESHIEASVGEYQVEKLNDLIVRLIAAALS